MPAPIRVELFPHSAAWAPAAEVEAARLRQILEPNFLAIHHIGSTAIAGIHAKPILDLMSEVRSLASLDGSESLFKNLGYEGWGEYGIAGRRYFTLDEPATGRRQVQLHCYKAGDAQLERHLAFRDYLRAHSAIAREYDAEKHRCRQLHPDDSHAYTEAKSAWIEAWLPLALDFWQCSR